jgi:hypothetical protein
LGRHHLRRRPESSLKTLEIGLSAGKIRVALEKGVEIAPMARKTKMDQLMEDHTLQDVLRCAR